MRRIISNSSTERARSAVVIGLLATSVIGPATPAARAQLTVPLSPQAAAKLKVLDDVRGTWDVTVRSRVTKAVVTYTETSEWVLDHRFLRVDTGPKSDGSQELYMITYFEPSGGYPMWVFSSSGLGYQLAPGRWDESARTMTWKSPPGASVRYEASCVYPTASTRRCTTVSKDWKGTAIRDDVASAVRRP